MEINGEQMILKLANTLQTKSKRVLSIYCF